MNNAPGSERRPLFFPDVPRSISRRAYDTARSTEGLAGDLPKNMATVSKHVQRGAAYLFAQDIDPQDTVHPLPRQPSCSYVVDRTLNGIHGASRRVIGYAKLEPVERGKRAFGGKSAREISQLRIAHDVDVSETTLLLIDDCKKEVMWNSHDLLVIRVFPEEKPLENLLWSSGFDVLNRRRSQTVLAWRRPCG